MCSSIVLSWWSKFERSSHDPKLICALVFQRKFTSFTAWIFQNRSTFILFQRESSPPTDIPLFTLAPNDGRNNWCTLRLRDFDFETFRDFFRLRDQKSSSAKARWHYLEGRPWLFNFSFRNIQSICLLELLKINGLVRILNLSDQRFT